LILVDKQYAGSRRRPADEGMTKNMDTHYESPRMGRNRLSGEELGQRISDMTVWGDYLRGFKYITFFDRDGTMEGRNNAGSHHLGRWSIDPEDGSFTVRWDSGWDNTTTYAYDVAGEIRFHDTTTGEWRTTLTRFDNGRSDLLSGPYWAEG